MTAPTLTAAERTVGRRLRASERIIDILGVGRRLHRAKEDLDAAIKAEQRRAVRRTVRRGLRTITLGVTDAMREPLNRLRRFGRREASAELERLGVRGLSVAPKPPPDDLERWLATELGALSVRLSSTAVSADLAGVSQTAVIAALARVPGARDIASRAVSTALMQGMAATFEQADDLIAGWEQTAVMDASTCEACEDHDGRTFATWAEVEEAMPNGGPDPDCLGGGRCRCRVVPLGG